MSAFLNQLRPLANLRWSPAENLHITTKFIGEWPDARVSEIEQALAALGKPGKLLIGIRGLGWFPNPHSPRVFWAGVDAPEGLKRLAADTASAMEKLGVASEARDFSPHLTLARTREGTTKEVLNSVRRAVAALESDEFGAFEADSQFLFQSAGGKYTKLARFSLV
jgi:2'-5' RNA ligase